MKKPKINKQKEEEKKVKEIIKVIKTFERKYTQELVERACNKYSNLNRNKRKAQKQIAKLEKQLQVAKKGLN